MAVRFFPGIIAAGLLTAAMTAPAPAADSSVFLKATAGGSYPFMQNLDNELAAQGTDELSAGLSFSMSIGRLFAERRWGLELWFDIALYQSFKYENDHESFEGDMTRYNFMLVGKRNLWPSSDVFRPYLGAGLGYGYTNISRAGGKIEGIQGMVLLQLESRIRDNISLFMEGTFLTAFSRDKYDSSFLEGSAYDAILDSNGDPLDDRFASADLRIGVMVWLKPPSRYGE